MTIAMSIYILLIVYILTLETLTEDSWIMMFPKAQF